MICFKLPLQQRTLAFSASIALASFLGSPIQAQAQSVKPLTPIQQKPANQRTSREQKAATRRFVPPPPPQNIGAPGQREGAASRGACPRINTPLTALVPVTQQALGKSGVNAESVWSLTVAAHPTFWFYVPYSPSSLRSTEFVLQDDADNDVYRTPVKLPEQPGVISLRLPSTSKPLENGRIYHWYFKLYCSPQETSNPIFVEGWVQRVTTSPALTSQLKAALTPQQRIDLYAAHGIWYDALTAVGELRLVNPEDATLKADWNALLQSVDLANIASKPLVPCCTPAN
jgi:hypothetical protein